MSDPSVFSSNAILYIIFYKEMYNADKGNSLKINNDPVISSDKCPPSKECLSAELPKKKTGYYADMSLNDNGRREASK